MRRLFRARRCDESDLTQRQRVLAGRVRDLLTAETVKFEERVDSNGEPVYVFEIATSAEASLRVRVTVIDDVFQFEANGALLLRDLAAWPVGHDLDWVEECIDVLKRLLQNDLRIRLCRTLFGRTARAVWLAAGKNEGGWNGELAAVRRRDCDEQVFSSWYQRSDKPPI